MKTKVILLTGMIIVLIAIGLIKARERQLDALTEDPATAIPTMTTLEAKTSEAPEVLGELTMGCEKDSDCVEILLPCSCCKFIAVPKQKQAEISQTKCSEPEPPCACERVQNKPVCRSGRCQLLGP